MSRPICGWRELLPPADSSLSGLARRFGTVHARYFDGYCQWCVSVDGGRDIPEDRCWIRAFGYDLDEAIGYVVEEVAERDALNPPRTGLRHLLGDTP